VTDVLGEDLLIRSALRDDGFAVRNASQNKTPALADE